MPIELITYSSSIKGLILQPPIELKTSNSLITKIEVKTEGEEGLILSFFLLNVFSEDEAKSITYDIARVLTNKISFKYGCRVSEPRCGCIMEDGCVSANSYVHFSDNLDGIISIERAEREHLRLYLETPCGDVGQNYLHLYCFIIKQDDPISRFLLLYGFLALIKGAQKKIDELILEIDSSVPKSKSPYPNSTAKSAQEETLFTRLRNEIMHPNDRKVDPAKTKEEMRINVSWLQDIVKRYLQSIS